MNRPTCSCLAKGSVSVASHRTPTLYRVTCFRPVLPRVEQCRRLSTVGTEGMERLVLCASVFQLPCWSLRGSASLEHEGDPTMQHNHAFCISHTASAAAVKRDAPGSVGAQCRVCMLLRVSPTLFLNAGLRHTRVIPGCRQQYQRMQRGVTRRIHAPQLWTGAPYLWFSSVQTGWVWIEKREEKMDELRATWSWNAGHNCSTASTMPVLTPPPPLTSGQSHL